MTSAGTGVQSGPAPLHRPGSSPWLGIGRSATLAAIVFCVLLQWINHDWFPPQISVSQYGVGPRGWVFTCWAALLALSVLALGRGGPPGRGRAPAPRSSRLARWCLRIGSAGLLVMGIVRTDAGGAQHSWHAKVHMAGSVVALLALPLGIMLALAWAARPWRRAALALTVISVAALLLVLASALGRATPGMDAEQSWAFWQSVAVTVDMMLVSVFALAGLDRRDHGGVATGLR